MAKNIDDLALYDFSQTPVNLELEKELERLSQEKLRRAAEREERILNAPDTIVEKVVFAVWDKYDSLKKYCRQRSRFQKTR